MPIIRVTPSLSVSPQAAADDVRRPKQDADGRRSLKILIDTFPAAVWGDA